jgi:hypothetical protein
MATGLALAEPTGRRPLKASLVFLGMVPWLSHVEKGAFRANYLIGKNVSCKITP